MTESRVEKVENFLAHYASKYYDPVKAHEYYERTKKLKGREPALSKESRQRQTEALAYARNEISTRRKADLDANAAAREKLSAAATAQAEAHKARMEKLQADAEAAREAIINKLKAEIEKIQGELKIPANASPKLRAFLERQHASRSKSAQAKAQKEMKELGDKMKAVVNSVREEYQKFREKNTADRRANAAQRRSIAEKYRNDLKTETQNIKDQVR